MKASSSSSMAAREGSDVGVRNVFLHFLGLSSGLMLQLENVEYKLGEQTWPALHTACHHEIK